MDPAISGCLQGDGGELGLAVSHSGERWQELCAGGKRTLRGKLQSQERVFPSCTAEIPWASWAEAGLEVGQPRPLGPPGAA